MNGKDACQLQNNNTYLLDKKKNREWKSRLQFYLCILLLRKQSNYDKIEY